MYSKITLLLLLQLLNFISALSNKSENVLPVMEEVVVNTATANLATFDDANTGCVVVEDALCLAVDDVSNFEAIKSLHRLLDDDKSGEIDMNESVDFLMEELTITDGYNSRQKNLHHNSDSFISVQDLWHMWKKSQVHNWTTEDTVQWLSDTVGLPQYGEAFVMHGINGSYLPRLTINKSNYLGVVLGIKGLSHRTKVTVKAMDAVLFGPPKGSHLKDMLIAGLVSVILLGLGHVIYRNHRMVVYHKSLIMQIEELQQEEVKYRQHLQEMKQKAREESGDRPGARASNDILDSGVGGDAEDSDDDDDDDDVSCSDDVNGGTTARSHDYDGYDSNETPPNDAYDVDGRLDRASLLHWLQVTYRREKLGLDSKRKIAQTRRVEALDICNKLRSRSNNPLNVFSLMHGKIDNVEKTISLARKAMHEVQRDEKELHERWSEIERLLDYNIRRQAELQNVMGSYTSLQTNSADPSNIADSTAGGRGGAGGSVRSTTSSSTRSTAQHIPTIPHHNATEFYRRDDDTESVCIPRCSSFGSNSVTRLASSASHQQLTDHFSDASYGSTRQPPQKRPRRHKASSAAKHVQPAANCAKSPLPSSTDGAPSDTAAGVPSSTAAGVPSSTATAVPSSTAAAVPSSTAAGVPSSTAAGVPSSTAAGDVAKSSADACVSASGDTDKKAAAFTIGGSPLVMSSCRSSTLEPADGTALLAKSRGIICSASDPALSALSPSNQSTTSSPNSTGHAPSIPSSTLNITSPALNSSSSALNSSGSAPSHHRTLSQLTSEDAAAAAKLTPNSKPRIKKKSFFERFTTGRKSVSKSSKT